MSDRSALIDTFLKHAGWGEGERSTLAADASFRRYFRMRDGRRRAVLMLFLEIPKEPKGELIGLLLEVVFYY